MTTTTTDLILDEPEVDPKDRAFQRCRDALEGAAYFEIVSRSTLSESQRNAAGHLWASYNLRALDFVKEVDVREALHLHARAELAARKRRAEILHELREDARDGNCSVTLGGDNYSAILAVQGMDKNEREVFNLRNLALLREVFEGCPLVVNRHHQLSHLFSHRDQDYRPWPTEDGVAGFFYDAEVGRIGGRGVLVAQLHLHESAKEVREYVRERLAAREAVGLSIETPGIDDGPGPEEGAEKRPPRERSGFSVWHVRNESDGFAERLPCIALVTSPAAGGRIFFPGDDEEAARYVPLGASVNRIATEFEERPECLVLRIKD